MKKTISNTIRGVAAAFFVLTAVSQAQAGPGPERLYIPVKSMKAAERIQPGTRIGISCTSCGGVTLMTADKERSFLKSFTCPACKTTFTPGGRGTGGIWSYVDSHGHMARLLTAKS